MSSPKVSRPGADPFTERTPRVVAARRLTKRSGRDSQRRFLAEGAQAVREALAFGTVHEIFVTDAAAGRNPELVETALARSVPVSAVTERAAAGLSETVTPQGVIAVCDTVDRPLAAALGERPMLVAVLYAVADPGNAGTVIRVADAAGADAVVLAGDTVDPHNGKCVRASAGSLFHVPIARCPDGALAACTAAGLRAVAADGHADIDLDTATGLAEPTAWIFGSEAHGLPADVLTSADVAIKVPIHGHAESLNLATAAAVCLYASARAQRQVTRAKPEPPVS